MSTIPVTAPFDGATIGEVETVDHATVERYLDEASALFRNRAGWLPLHRRIEILERAAEIMRQRRDELTRQAAHEGGKPWVDSLVEADRAVASIAGCAEVLRSEPGEMIPMGASASSRHRVAFTRHEPIGPVVAVSAFNHPINLIAHQIGPAIANGCPVLVKPSADTPLSCRSLVQIFREAGLDEPWCRMTVTDSRTTAEAMITDRRVAFFSFIGSAPVGWMLHRKLAAGCRSALEHGGAAPVIVAADADLGRAVPALLKGGFYHAGQVCVSVQRIYAHQDIADELIAALVEGAGEQVVGDPLDPKTEVGPLIRPRENQRVNAMVKAVASTIAAGGETLSESCHQPTVLVDPPGDAEVSTTEIFGPVICVYRYSDMADALARANALPFAFQAAVFSQDIDTAMAAASGLDASAVMVNDHTAFRVDWMPFAGLRQSGLGIGGIPHTIKDMRIEKMLVLNSPAL